MRIQTDERETVIVTVTMTIEKNTNPRRNERPPSSPPLLLDLNKSPHLLL